MANETTPLLDRLRTLLDGSGRSLHSITREAGADYFKTWRWYTGANRTIDAETADKVCRYLETQASQQP